MSRSTSWSWQVALLGAVGCAIWGVGCATNKAAVAVTPSEASTATGPTDGVLAAGEDFDGVVASPPRPLAVFGVTRPIGAQAAMRSARKLDAYLTRQLGGEVAARMYADANLLGEALANGQVEVAWLTPAAFVRARQRADIKPLVRISRGGFTSYRSVLFVRKSSPIRSIGDARGAAIAWAGPASASGRALPRAYLRSQNIDPDTFFGTKVDLTDHSQVCQTVLTGKADVGATFADERGPDVASVVDGCREAGLDPAEFRVLARTEPVPSDVVAIRADTPPLVEERLRQALLNLAQQPDGQAQLQDIFHADGFADVSLDDFSGLQALEKYLAQ